MVANREEEEEADLDLQESLAEPLGESVEVASYWAKASKLSTLMLYFLANSGVSQLISSGPFSVIHIIAS